jgi:hypothetical protein
MQQRLRLRQHRSASVAAPTANKLRNTSARASRINTGATSSQQEVCCRPDRGMGKVRTLNAVILLHDFGTAADAAAMICTYDDSGILRIQEISQSRHIIAYSHFAFNQTLSRTKCQKK